MPNPQKTKGFTLIELLVVIAIIAMLLAILMPSLRKAKKVARRLICMNNARQTGMCIGLYAENHDGIIMPQSNAGGGEYTNDPINYKPADCYMVYTGPVGNMSPPFHLALLYETGLVENPESFYCPAQPIKSKLNYDYYTKKGTIEWGSDGIAPNENGNWHVRTSWQYWNGVERRLSKLKGHKPLVFDSMSTWDNIPHRKSGPESMPQGITVLYVDGHVSFVSDPELFSADTWNYQNIIDGDGNEPVVFQRILKMLEGR